SPQTAPFYRLNSFDFHFPQNLMQLPGIYSGNGFIYFVPPRFFFSLLQFTGMLKTKILNR
ncbi:MAG: hypothetical protein LBK57_05820, partial [Clostridiales Family XIII bacterium]|nr:hypothetical protein [Clostridiales Family XIII bacterium]